MKATFVRKGMYFDSVKLMLVTQKIKQLPGIIEAGVVMGTDLNKDILARVGLLSEEGAGASAADLLIGINAETEEVIKEVTSTLDSMLNASASSGVTVEYRPKSLDGALVAQKESNFAIISIPGRFAALEAHKALTRGLHVLLFSDNVSLDDERRLKEYAKSRNLLLMGPDCGTALINGVPLGFANKVRRGKIGLVGASGTGLQEVSTLIHKRGSGVSHAIGTGGRDLSEAIGGITMLQGIEALSEDPATEVIVLISKPPAAIVAQKIIGAIKEKVKKPVVINFLGAKDAQKNEEGITFASTLEEAAFKAVTLETGNALTGGISEAEIERIVQREKARISPHGYLRGLYSGGTLNYEAILILEEMLGGIYSNTPVNKAFTLEDPFKLSGHACIDLGDDAFTVGRAHPMIDPTLRNQMFESELGKADVSIILFDIVLGYGAHEHPEQGILEILQRKAKEASHKLLIATLCGTDDDPQGYDQIDAALTKAGVIVAHSNRSAATIAGRVLGHK